MSTVRHDVTDGVLAEDLSVAMVSLLMSSPAQ
jgi:hypothetical protein